MFNSVHAKGGSAGTSGAGGRGGTGGTGSATKRIAGAGGGIGTSINNAPGANGIGGAGASGYFGGGGAAEGGAGVSGGDGSANSGGGGASESVGNTLGSTLPGGGGSGEYVILDISSPASTYTYTIGAGGTSTNGGNGGSGFIQVTEYYAEGGGGTITLTGDVTGSGTSSIATTIASSVALAGNPTTTTQSSGDSSTKIATTAFVSTAISAITAGLDARPSCRVATTAALTATYSNGSSGVGATLTNSGTQAAVSIDGVSLAANDRVLVHNQSTAAQNGIYTVTTVGSGSTNWVLTRATDFNTASSTGVVEGAFTVIEEGTTLFGTFWIETGQGPFTIGTTAITFTQLQVTNVNLTNAHILVGNASNIAADVAVSGDVTITNAGVTSIKSNVALAGNPTTTTQSQGNNSTKIATTAYVDTGLAAKSSSTLTSAHLFVGNASNVATDTAITGDVTFSNTGVTTIKSNVALAGSPTTTTQSSSDNTTNIATTAFVQSVVSAISAGLDARPSCRVATTAALTATYSNGSSGVGATLTNSGTQAAISIDGVSLAVSDRVLVKNQATAAQNGIYTVTTVGSGATNWVLTRSTDFNTASPTGVVEGAFTVIEEGTTQFGTFWIETGQGPFTIGTTAITFTQLQVANVNLTDGHILVGNSSNIAADVAMSGDVTISDAGVTTIGAAAVTASKLASNLVISSFGITIDGGGVVPSTGSKGFVTIPYSGTITNWYLAADQAGSCVIDVKRSGSSIIGTGNKPTLSSAQTGNAAVSGWTSTAISAGDIIEFNLNSVTTITRVNLVIKLNRS